MSTITKPVFRFQFPDEVKGTLFYKRVHSFPDVSQVHYPLRRDSGEFDKAQVFVHGTGSLVFDIALKDKLQEISESLGGVIL